MENLRRHEESIARLSAFLQSRRHQGLTHEEWLRRPETNWDEIVAMAPDVSEIDADRRSVEQVVVETKYAGYIRRQAADIERAAKIESVRIPPTFDFAAVPQLRFEAKEKLGRVRPESLAQAGRISGITPADLTLLMLHLRRPETSSAS